MRNSLNLAATMWIPIDPLNLPATKVLAASVIGGEISKIGYGRLDHTINFGVCCFWGVQEEYAVKGVAYYFDPNTLEIPQNEIKLGESI